MSLKVLVSVVYEGVGTLNIVIKPKNKCVQSFIYTIYIYTYDFTQYTVTSKRDYCSTKDDTVTQTQQSSTESSYALQRNLEKELYSISAGLFVYLSESLVLFISICYRCFRSLTGKCRTTSSC